MKDIVVAFVGAALIGGLLISKKDIVENWGLLPARSVSVEKIVQVENVCNQGGEGSQQALGADVVGPSSDFYTVPPNMQSALAPRFSNVDMGSNIRYNLPDNEYLAAPANALTYGPSNMVNLPKAGLPSCNQGQMGGCSKENYEDERYEPISQAARVPAAQQKAQALADMGMIKARNQPNMSVDTECGPASVTVVDRLVFANQKSRLYGQGDPIRGDIGCIVPIKDAWFRPSVRPNIDLRAGALSIMGGLDNETPRELRALQNIYSAGVSNIQSDAYGNTVNPSLAQKSMSIEGPFAAQSDISVSGFP